jgi:succinate dehydrogenase/fumarate reductase cytochrome b subunit
MSNLLTASIGRKLLMSISGLFLILFLFVHLTINSFLLLDGVWASKKVNCSMPAYTSWEPIR